MRSRAAVLAVIATFVAALPAQPARAADRLPRVAAALERGPLFVHPDLLWLVPAARRAEIVQTLRGAAVPVRVAVLPVIREDESHGDPRRILFGIQRRLDRPGVLVVADQDGALELESFGVPRDIDVPIDLALSERGPASAEGLRARLAQLVEIVDRAPPGPVRPPKPRFSSYSDDDSAALSVWQVILVGAFLGAVAHLAVRFAVFAVSYGAFLLRARRAS